MLVAKNIFLNVEILCLKMDLASLNMPCHHQKETALIFPELVALATFPIQQLPNSYFCAKS
jgi:hypothetical protein